jgi:hypothetical protein
MRAAGLAVGVAEAEQVQGAAGTDHRRQARHIVAPLATVERVEEPAVEHRLERSAEAVQVQGVAVRELGVEHRARERAVVRQANDRRLRAS